MAQQRNRACYGAVLLPTPVFATLPSEQVSSEGQVAAMTYRLFEDHASAEEWLGSLP
ncbi:hypothetical protein ACFQT0_29435 [Hymenobacter humi]|uniref:Uncharacterized protein n=1 Tax=Hymenobacter humi TaxID=1411620 RepID=A0ABW2UDZ0_9BACT